MQVEILSVEHTQDGRTRVEVRNEHGRIRADWSGKPAPAAGERRDVEWGVSESLVWGQSIRPVSAAPGMEPLDDGVALHATLEGCDEDGFAALRLGESLVMVEAFGDPPPPGTPVRAELARVTLHDTGL
jgi:hypothetical protein